MILDEKIDGFFIEVQKAKKDKKKKVAETRNEFETQNSYQKITHIYFQRNTHLAPTFPAASIGRKTSNWMSLLSLI